MQVWEFEKKIDWQDLSKMTVQGGARLNEIIDSLPHPAMLIRKDQIILAANHIARQFGAKVGDYCWRSFGQFGNITYDPKRYISDHKERIPPGGTRCIICKVDEAIEKSKPINAPELKAFGQLWDTWWFPIYDELYLHYTINIPESKQAETESLKGEEKFHEIAETRVKFLFEVDLQERITYISPQIDKILGFRDCEVKGNIFNNYAILSDLPKVDVAFQKVISEVQNEFLEIKVKSKIGKIIPLEIKLIPIIETQKVTGVLGTARVISLAEAY